MNWKFGFVAYDGFLYGPDWPSSHKDRSVKCLDIKTGKLRWTQNYVGCGLTISDGKLLIWDGERLRVALASPDGYKELAISPKLPSAVSLKELDIWDSSRVIPVLANGRVYCRNNAGELFCLDLRGK